MSILCGDAIAVLRTLPEASVHCVVTSPPYWGLRDYGVDGQIGLEKSPEAWCARLVDVFRELRRVLRADGTAWLNVGDAYASTTKGSGGTAPSSIGHGRGQASNAGSRYGTRAFSPGIRPKNLLGLPWQLAFALRADGWWLRSEIIWSKPNCLPESVTDRPTRNHEQVFLLTRSARYYYDADAIREPQVRGPENFGAKSRCGTSKPFAGDAVRAASPRIAGKPRLIDPRGANRRTVWSISPEPFAGAHFATFPTALVEPCILAGTSARGACAACGAPYARVVERGAPDDARILAGMLERRTVGWAPTCACDDPREPVPCVVLDPFSGSGTTCLVAHRLGRAFVGIEINPAYCEMAKQRLHDEAPLFATEP